jgi:hypothetical protein
MLAWEKLRSVLPREQVGEECFATLRDIEESAERKTLVKAGVGAGPRRYRTVRFVHMESR